jgi:hypothetical protein
MRMHERLVQYFERNNLWWDDYQHRLVQLVVLML